MSGTEGRAPAHVELDAFLDARAPGLHERWPDPQRFEARLAWQRELFEGGWVGLGWPEALGGRALDVVERVRCDEVLAEHDAPMLAGVLGINNVAPSIIAHGTDEQKQHLPAILAGDEIWCQGFSEPEAGSDLASLRTSARRDGDEFVVHGHKLWTSNGMEATHCQLLVRTGGGARHAGVSCLLVSLDRPGVERRPIRQIDGRAEFAEMFFDEVRVPASALLGDVDDGWAVTMTTLAHERAGVLSLAIGLASQLSREVPDLLQRLGPDDPRRDAVVRRWADAQALRFLGERVMARLAAGQKPGPEQAVIKLAWGLAQQRATEMRLADPAIGPDLDRGHDGVQEFLRGRSLTIAAGTTEILKNLLAERVLGLPRGG